MLRPESEALQRPFGARFGARLGACFGAPSDVRFSIVGQRPVRSAVRCAVQHAVRRLAGRAGSGWLRTVPFADRGVMRSVEILCVRPRYHAPERCGAGELPAHTGAVVCRANRRAAGCVGAEAEEKRIPAGVFRLFSLFLSEVPHYGREAFGRRDGPGTFSVIGRSEL